MARTTVIVVQFFDNDNELCGEEDLRYKNSTANFNTLLRHAEEWAELMQPEFDAAYYQVN